MKIFYIEYLKRILHRRKTTYKVSKTFTETLQKCLNFIPILKYIYIYIILLKDILSYSLRADINSGKISFQEIVIHLLRAKEKGISYVN